jgi:hypothetical protein
MEREKRIDGFLKKIVSRGVVIPDSSKDFGTYKSMNEAFEGLNERLDYLRRNHGRVGYSSQNVMSDLTKEYVIAVQNCDEEAMAFLSNDMENVMEGFSEAAEDGAFAEAGNSFSRTMWQEKYEADLFGKFWPVIAGKANAISSLLPWNKAKGNIQAYLYGFLDVVSELGKAVTEELSSPDMTSKKELELFERYLAVASSITLRLSQERHAPGYVINNAYGRWASYTTKLRTAYGTIAAVRREYNLRLSIRRMLVERA